MNRFRLDGKVAIVTGATAGIGRAAALGLAEAGADIVVRGKSHDPEGTCKAIRPLGRQALGLQGDICDGGFAEHVVNETLARWDHLDILVNSAGLQIRTPSVDFAEADWDKV